jgi:hypothetical protein
MTTEKVLVNTNHIQLLSKSLHVTGSVFFLKEEYWENATFSKHVCQES